MESNHANGKLENCINLTKNIRSKNVINEILDEMKTKFNKLDKNVTDNLIKNNVAIHEANGDNRNTVCNQNTAINHTNGKPRIVLLFKKPTKSERTNCEQRKMVKRNRTKSNEQHHVSKCDNEDGPNTRTTRRRSKVDNNQSVLQNAIARKEKSYNVTTKPQRSNRQLKPTQKILDNLAQANSENKKNDRSKIKSVSSDEDDGKRSKKRSKTSENNSKSRKLKTVKVTYSVDTMDCTQHSDVDIDPSGDTESEEMVRRRSRRLSSSRGKPEANHDSESISSNNSEDCDDDKEVNGIPTARLCQCTKDTNFYLAPSDSNESNFCSALDSINEKVFGCSRTVDIENVFMMRPSTRVPFGLYCTSHKNRLLQHNCCPTCGMFCTQGRFLKCNQLHQYHKDCQLMINEKNCCPHCGEDSEPQEIQVNIHFTSRPIFLPIQKTKISTARITFAFNNNNNKSDEEEVLSCDKMWDTLEMWNDTTEGVFKTSDLILAIKQDDVGKVATILRNRTIDLDEKVADLNDGTILHYACQSGQISMVHLLVTSGAQTDFLNGEQNTPIMLATLAHKNDIVNYLIKIGASIELKGTDGMSVLHLAAKCGNLDACKIILKYAKLRCVKNVVNSCDDGGWTPLVWASEHGYVDVASYLICNGADTTIRDAEHNVALHWASFSGSSDIAEILIENGSEVDAVNAHGDTPLHIGARQDMFSCVVVLLAKGANPMLLNKNNESPLDCVPTDGACYHPISLNIRLQLTVDWACHKTILTNDITRGRELNPIQCCNNTDNEPAPADFTYITKNCIASDDVRIDRSISTMQSCTCQNRCLIDENCCCGQMSIKCWYDEEGKLSPDFDYVDIPMIFECNDACACNAITCQNRVLQKGVTQRFELFKTTSNKGWGIKTIKLIPKGVFVCEYVGEIISDEEADRRDDDSYVFDLENRIYKSVEDANGYCIDAKFYGNFARFINHSCCPNLTSVKVFVEHHDLKFPRIAFFATRNILPDEELCYDYGEKFWTAKKKFVSCQCGSAICKYS